MARVDMLELLRNPPRGDTLRIAAPMVRYSKLAFRLTVRQHGTDVAYTPMIMADSFTRSQKARDIEFTTCATDWPLVVQFGAHNAVEFATAAALVTPYADAVDLNCGCPQRWALQEGIGASLITKPELVHDMVVQARGATNLPVAVKVRICKEDKDTVELVRRLEAARVSWITVHGRTVTGQKDPVSLAHIKLVKESVGVPVVANGDICSEEDVARTRAATGVDGVMAARGLLANPAMFSGATTTTPEVVRDYVSHAIDTGTPFTCMHHHIMYMLENFTNKIDKRELHTLHSTPALLDYLDMHYGI